MAETVKRVYAFGKDADGNNVTEGNTSMKMVLGGKGANLAEMANIGLPVPPGFTITCQTCMEYANADNTWPEGALDTIREYREDLEARMGKRIGDAEDPLLVSVRSGAPMSMPGMMDTVLNLGLNDQSINGLIAQTENPRFAWDSYRRFIQMFSNVVMGLDGDLFENAITAMKNARGVASDTDLTAEDLQELVREFKDIFSENVLAADYPSLVVDGEVQFPQDPMVQLQLAIEAVFGSWNNPRATLYRKQNKIADDLGTAVNVQSMVFGNKGNTSATGVAFTRNPANGEAEFYGDYLVNAQGEDVVAGIRNTSPIAELKEVEGLEEAGLELEGIFTTLENHFRDMCDIEFTIEQGKLWMLQTRVGKRTAAAALHIAIEMEKEGLITKEEAVKRVDPEQLDQLLHPQFDKNATYDVLARGLNASPGAAVGEAVFSAADAVAAAEAGRKCVLVRWETNPDDLAGMIAAEGILTSHGGKTSHAAVIARGMGAPCVCGVESLKIDAEKKQAVVSGTDVVISEGDVVSIDGTSGIVVLGAVDLVMPELTGDLDTILEWADEFRTLGVRANADNPEDAALSRSFGAQGIGLCRTEHMFLGDRKQIIQTFILNEDEAVREKAVNDLFEAQTGDFYGMFKAMDGLPVIVRLLDPPLHEFLESPRALDVEIARMEATGADAAAVAEKRELMEKIDSFAEQNPMLGMRGCRLGIVYPILPVMQVRAIATAMAKLKKEGFDPKPEVMIPLVSVKAELEKLRGVAEKTIAEVEAEQGVTLEIPIGTMIELPRAAVTADDIAKHADFFSFGTNDLTQTTFGFSRDDVEGEFVPQYLAQHILPYNPFATIDRGVAKLVAMGVKLGHEGNPDLMCGVCGEHGGDPDSIHIFQECGVNYVSCSPYRVPIARLAAAQAALENK
ncbi:pyruvate, phosphate dikinase [Xiamenia xianingshaonis]|uniref:Pyruvate, phosphate dikinase n=1 Tax=Xiamenia xianingshaonis TaxID=2682776 RepID=A0A9E6MNZ0_9ACTN|nr:pyruvate, phosphate dikinase [Xiamenia xianingshaonis]NGM17141.1 pyruvate, phosphate dikinase [Eggerthellaceae bacterium zg-893]NHM13824.1 pyruvate, phosphate dikinase [Xiamenia xianingshaonis]NHM16181.1 pyruvate, phosphate dikinase [Xiamenia xianingshaonis]QTU83684.1 pyruvate, phosphate dikinase [Xiamenia xianingshaonis]